MQIKFYVLYSLEAENFIKSLPLKVQQKILYNISKSQYFIDNTLFKKIKDTDLWEFRTLYNGTCYRLLAFWDKTNNALVIATNGFIKKTQKTPQNEIEKAYTIMKEYYKQLK